MPKEHCLLTFASTHAALRSEKLLRQRGVPFLLIPTPREISAGCGLTLRVLCDQVQEVQEILAAAGVSPEECSPHRKAGAGSLLDKFPLDRDPGR